GGLVGGGSAVGVSVGGGSAVGGLVGGGSAVGGSVGGGSVGGGPVGGGRVWTFAAMRLGVSVFRVARRSMANVGAWTIVK
ncbi:hypothetical protein, partial [Actinoplanes teichomyceticus]|uniref:hypothetical protein n=1 Tax=Actinoplanes teichomyceticus TaxID=1867 RepID=UPI00194487E0